MTTFAGLEQQKAEILAGVSDWTAARLAYRPAAGAWSTAQVIDHLVKVERGILVAARPGLAAPRPLGVRDRIGFGLLDWLFRSERRVKVPRSAPQVLPEPAPEFGAVRDAWESTRHELAEFLAPLEPDQLHTGIFRHPVSGWMSVAQILRFFEVHMIHHRFQLARLRAASEGM